MWRYKWKVMEAWIADNNCVRSGEQQASFLIPDPVIKGACTLLARLLVSVSAFLFSSSCFPFLLPSFLSAYLHSEFFCLSTCSAACLFSYILFIFLFSLLSFLPAVTLFPAFHPPSCLPACLSFCFSTHHAILPKNQLPLMSAYALIYSKDCVFTDSLK